jgi:hypothetical protein
MTVRQVIETAFAPLKAISKFIDFLLGFVPYLFLTWGMSALTYKTPEGEKEGEKENDG